MQLNPKKKINKGLVKFILIPWNSILIRKYKFFHKSA